MSVEEHNRLIEWTRCSKGAQPLRLRARIVLACAHGEPDYGVTKRLRVTSSIVGKWRQRFLELHQVRLLDTSHCLDSRARSVTRK